MRIAPNAPGGTHTRRLQQAQARGRANSSATTRATTVATYVGAGMLVAAALVGGALVLAKACGADGPMAAQHVQYRYKKDCVFLVSPDECREVKR